MIMPLQCRRQLCYKWYAFSLSRIVSRTDTISATATGFSTLFPGLDPHLMTLSSNFKIPFYRDILLALGICSVSMQSCSNILKQGPGSCLTIVVGGAAESLSAHPGTNDLTLRRRLGFLKLAMRSGADLVPVFSFGENDVRSILNVS